MIRRIYFRNQRFMPVLFAITVLIFSANVQAQNAAIDGERADCQITLNEKNSKANGARSGNKSAKPFHTKMKPALNRYGSFNQVYSIQPKGKVPVELFYPDAAKGDKVVIAVLDGGALDNGKNLKVMHLNEQKKIAFNFQVSGSSGVHRVMLNKDMDTKIIELWVGDEPSPAKTTRK